MTLFIFRSYGHAQVCMYSTTYQPYTNKQLEHLSKRVDFVLLSISHVQEEPAILTALGRQCKPLMELFCQLSVIKRHLDLSTQNILKRHPSCFYGIIITFHPIHWCWINLNGICNRDNVLSCVSIGVTADTDQLWTCVGSRTKMGLFFQLSRHCRDGILAIIHKPTYTGIKMMNFSEWGNVHIELLWASVYMLAWNMTNSSEWGNKQMHLKNVYERASECMYICNVYSYQGRPSGPWMAYGRDESPAFRTLMMPSWIAQRERRPWARDSDTSPRTSYHDGTKSTATLMTLTCSQSKARLKIHDPNHPCTNGTHVRI